MTETTLPKYAEIEKILSTTSLKLHPSQVQGMICGMICGDVPKGNAWETLLTGEDDSDENRVALHALFASTQKALQDFQFEFQLLLPDDDASLTSRAEALTLWCQGFLTGLKFVNIPIVNRAQSDVTEALNDVIEIAKMKYEEVVSSEEDEAAYIELVEYVRMVAILVYQETRPHDSKATPKHLN